MTSTTPFLDAVAARRTIYDLAPTMPIPESRIIEIMTQLIKNVPSPFNMQTCRCVILFQDEHRKFWDIVRNNVEATWPPEAAKMLFPRIAWYRAGYGSILFFEDNAVVRQWQADKKSIAHLLPQWSEHSSGMHQYAAWVALEAEGLGVNLQHYEGLEAKVSKEWNTPTEWSLKSQMVFGQPTHGPRVEKVINPIEERLFVHGRKE